MLIGDAPAGAARRRGAGRAGRSREARRLARGARRAKRGRARPTSVRRALERIRSALAGRERGLPPEERGPFPGLERYEATDRDVFFGRSAEIAGVIELARTRGLVGIVGLSGSGKSSITRAGILPAIEEGALGGWPKKYRSVLVTPGTDLMARARHGAREAPRRAAR